MADTPDLSKMLEQLMADEKFGEIVNAVKGSLSADADNAEPSPSPQISTDAENAVIEASPAIPKLSPELMAKLPEIMGMLSGGEAHSGSALADRKRLLNALKPFLSENRRNAVDSIVNIAGIADLFGI